MAVQLRTVTGQLSQMRGRGLLQLRLGETAFDQEVWVTDIQDQCILGLDILQQARGRLDLAKGTVTFGAGPPLLLDEAGTPPSATAFTGTLVHARPFKGSCKRRQEQGINQAQEQCQPPVPAASTPPPRIPASASPFKGSCNCCLLCSTIIG
ncbi:hypothetical protein EOD39_3824 [Acipenser ruthenus]|uniref:Uncharacterized protein n=1 Tax=Acipenser ruthenus TaxID=7906 RepID=A0A444ULC6_ACIRT|nr:hypothetical protein EOD39_3824 [Acipenser ruthenus]